MNVISNSKFIAEGVLSWRRTSPREFYDSQEPGPASRMNVKEKIRETIKSFLGISMLEREIKGLRTNDLSLELDRRALCSSAEFIEKHMQKATALKSNLEVIDFALNKIQHEGMYCEFGVYQGNTLNYTARKIKSTIYGFDSFKGLPEFWRDGFPAGRFGIDTDNLPRCEKNVELIVGWFEETLPSFVIKHPGPVAFLHIDCDLYSSTRTIFEKIGPRIRRGSVLVFDEYFNYPGWPDHEHKAFNEFIHDTGHKFEFLCYNRFHEQVAVQIL